MLGDWYLGGLRPTFGDWYRGGLRPTFGDWYRGDGDRDGKHVALRRSRDHQNCAASEKVAAAVVMSCACHLGCWGCRGAGGTSRGVWHPVGR